jgi:hypothetical protein
VCGLETTTVSLGPFWAVETKKKKEKEKKAVEKVLRLCMQPPFKGM